MTREMSLPRLAKWSQFSLRQLGIAAALIGMGSYSLANASELWLRFWLTVFAVTVTTSCLLLIYRAGEQRAFWVGYAVFGGLYLSLIASALGFRDVNSMPTMSGSLVTRMYPQTALGYVYFHVLPLIKDPPAPGGLGGGFGGMGGGGMGGGGFFAVPDLLGQFGGAGMTPGASNPPAVPAPPTSGAAYYPDLDTFLAVGHCLFGLAIAYAGGLAAQVICLTRPKVEIPTT
jgi:hypothetical protein